MVRTYARQLTTFKYNETFDIHMYIMEFKCSTFFYTTKHPTVRVLEYVGISLEYILSSILS